MDSLRHVSFSKDAMSKGSCGPGPGKNSPKPTPSNGSKSPARTAEKKQDSHVKRGAVGQSTPNEPKRAKVCDNLKVFNEMTQNARQVQDLSAIHTSLADQFLDVWKLVSKSLEKLFPGVAEVNGLITQITHIGTYIKQAEAITDEDAAQISRMIGVFETIFDKGKQFLDTVKKLSALNEQYCQCEVDLAWDLMDKSSEEAAVLLSEVERLQGEITVAVKDLV